MRRLGVIAPALATLLLLSGCAAAPVQKAAAGSDSVSADGAVRQWKQPTTAPVTFSGTTVEGTTFSSKQYLGKVLVVNFWYAGCPPCQAEAPTLNALADEHKGDVQFIGIDVIDDRATAARFARTYKSTYPSILDQEGGASVQLAFAASRPPKAVPTTLVLDRTGRITGRIVGLANKSVLDTLIDDTVGGTAR